MTQTANPTASNRRIGHWTPRYVFNKLKLSWLQRMHPDKPWLAWPMIEVLESILKPTDVGFEWGSGRSTTWFAQRIASLTSVEHHRGWFDQVEAMLADKGFGNKTNLLYREITDEDDLDDAYVHAIDDQGDVSLDFILVDGNKRDACALRALPKLKPGGIIVIDDVQRYVPARINSYAPAGTDVAISEGWQEFERLTEGWECVWKSDGVHDTALWIRPSS